MEKENPECVSTVSIKPDYPPSEYSSEPPPAYMKAQSSAVQVAKIVAVTVVLMSFVLGSFILAAAYVNANASCKQLEQELELLSEVADRFDSAPPLQPEALIQENPQQKRHSDPLQAEESHKNTKEIDNNNIDQSEDDSNNSSESEEDEKPIKFHLPLQLDFDDLAGALIEKNQKSKMNCIVEKKRAEEVVDHQPKTVRLPFGLNLTTDPRFERLTGERMVIVCESGNIQSAQPNTPPRFQPQEDDDDDDQEQDTIMIQPVMIPIPQTAFQTHMPQRMPPPPPPQQQQQLFFPPQSANGRRAFAQQFVPPQMIAPQMRPMHPMEAMRPPMPPPMRDSEEEMRPSMTLIRPGQVQIQVQSRDESQEMTPNPIIQHIIQQIITQKIMETQKAREEQNQQDQQQQNSDDQEPQQPQFDRRPIPDSMMMNRLPIPEEILTQLNRLPNTDRVIVAVASSDSSEEDSSSSDSESSEESSVQPPRSAPVEITGRQTYARGMPVNIPVPMMQPVQEPEQETQTAAAEETRPHYVQPRSVEPLEEAKSRAVRSANPLLPEKRVKRCACDCAC